MKHPIRMLAALAALSLTSFVFASNEGAEKKADHACGCGKECKCTKDGKECTCKAEKKSDKHDEKHPEKK